MRGECSGFLAEILFTAAAWVELTRLGIRPECLDHASNFRSFVSGGTNDRKMDDRNMGKSWMRGRAAGTLRSRKWDLFPAPVSLPPLTEITRRIWHWLVTLAGESVNVAYLAHHRTD